MFDELVKQQPNHIECKDQNLGLDQILKVVLSNTSAEPLRIPKTPERPTDFKLASGYTSEYVISLVSYIVSPFAILIKCCVSILF